MSDEDIGEEIKQLDNPGKDYIIYMQLQMYSKRLSFEEMALKILKIKENLHKKIWPDKKLNDLRRKDKINKNSKEKKQKHKIIREN